MAAVPDEQAAGPPPAAPSTTSNPATPESPVASTSSRAANPVAEGSLTPSDRVAELPTSSIARDPARFQFKQNVDEQGVGRELKSVDQYNPALAGVLSVWKDPTDGQTYIVNGHHRLELAERSGQPTVLAQYLDAATPGEARAQGALINIAEGRGTALDAAKFFRDSGMGPDDIRAQGVSLSGSIAKNGAALSKLDPAVFDKVATGKLSETHGALIGSMLERPEPAIAAASLIENAPRVPSNPEAAEVIKQVAQAGSTEGTQDSLFGTEQLSRSLIHERAAVAAELQKRMASDKRLFGYVGQEGRANELARAGNTINVDASQQLGQQSAALLEGFNREAYASGPVGHLITEAAERVANGEKPRAVAADVYPAVRDAVHASITGSGAAHGSALEARGADGEPAPDNSSVGRPPADSPTAEGLEPLGLNGAAQAARDNVFGRAQSPTLDDLAEHFGVRESSARSSVASPSLDDLASHFGVNDSRAVPSGPDLFGNVRDGEDAQTGMFSDREGTVAARTLKRRRPPHGLSSSHSSSKWISRAILQIVSGLRHAQPNSRSWSTAIRL